MERVRKNYTIELLICTIVPLFFYAFTMGSKINNNVIYMIYFCILALQVVKYKYIIIPSNMKVVFFSIFIVIVVFPIIFLHIDSYNGLIYISLLIVFFFIVSETGYYMLDSYDKILLIWAIFGTIIVLGRIITNFDEINSDTIRGVFYTVDTEGFRYRAKFGFLHANSAAIIMVTLLFIYYSLIKFSSNKWKKIILFVLIIAIMVPLLCTGSRTAAISIVSFVCFEILFYMIQNSRINKLFITMIITLILLVVISQLNFQELLANSSGRDKIISNSFKGLRDSGNLLFGYVVRNISHADNVYSSINASGTDSWYFMFILRFGIVGLLLFIIPLLYKLAYLYNVMINSKIETFPLSAILALLVYGLSENVLYNQGIPLCFLVWVMLFRMFYISEKIIRNSKGAVGLYENTVIQQNVSETRKR